MARIFCIRSCDEIHRGLRQPFHRDAIMPEDVGLAAGDRVFVGNADDFERRARDSISSDAHASPRPPCTMCSSTVIIARQSRAASKTAAVSSGLIVCMLK